MTDHAEYQWIVNNIGEPEWIWPGTLEQNRNPEEPYEFVQGPNAPKDDTSIGSAVSGHGTCMLSKAVGNHWGVSKKPKGTIVRIPRSLPGIHDVDDQGRPLPVDGLVRWSAIVDAMTRIALDIQAKGIQKKAIINLSLADLPDDARVPPQAGDFMELFYAIQGIIQLHGAIVVVSAGNRGEEAPGSIIHTMPTIWSLYLPIIVAGAAELDGSRAPWSQYQSSPNWPNAGVDIWAPARDNTACASPSRFENGAEYDNDFMGSTSAAAAVTSSFVAYLLGVPKHLDAIRALIPRNDNSGGTWAAAVKSYVKTKAYKRSAAADITVMYSDEIPLGNDQRTPVCVAAGPFAKRQNGSPPFPIGPFNPSASTQPSASLTSTSHGSTSSSSPTTSLPSTSVDPKTSAPAKPTSTAPAGFALDQEHCLAGTTPDMKLADSNWALLEFCNRDYTWQSKSQPPVNVTGTAGTAATFSMPGITDPSYITTLQVSPFESAGVCVTTLAYPRTLTSADCTTAFTQLQKDCPKGGTLDWVASDGQGCVQAFISQAPNPANPPPTPPDPKVSIFCLPSNDMQGQNLPADQVMNIVFAKTSYQNVCANQAAVWATKGQGPSGLPGEGLYYHETEDSSTLGLSTYMEFGPTDTGGTCAQSEKLPMFLSPADCVTLFDTLLSGDCTRTIWWQHGLPILAGLLLGFAVSTEEISFS